MRRLDYKHQLVDYFKRNLAKKYNHDTLKFALISQGYSRVAVLQAYEEAIKQMSEDAPVLKEKPIIRHEIYDMNNKLIHPEPMGHWEKFWLRLKGNRI
ncbi:hypothetical protein GW932_01105 [archaeon]|nr:hypothetical protein [archaeon]